MATWEQSTKHPNYRNKISGNLGSSILPWRSTVVFVSSPFPSHSSSSFSSAPSPSFFRQSLAVWPRPQPQPLTCWNYSSTTPGSFSLDNLCD